MVCAFVRVVNNTNTYVHYYNTESKKRITVPPKSKEQENNGWIPAESCDDWVPYAKDGDYIEVSIGDSGPVRISDDDYKWKFVDYPDGDTRQGNESWVKGLEATQYVLLFKPVKKGEHTQGAISIYKYDSQKMGTTGYIIASVLQSAAPVVALVLMAIFL